jgi:hypothetical protein
MYIGPFSIVFFGSNNQILYKTGVLIDRPIILQLINNYYSSTILQAYHKYDLEFYHYRNVTLFAYNFPLRRHTTCAASLLFFQLDPFFFAYGDKNKPTLIFKQCLFSILA